MKSQDIISVVSIAVVGTLIAYFIMNALLGDPLDKTISFDYLDFDAGQFYTPDGEMFNPAAINPTVDVYVGTCVDINHNGLLEDFEKVACGQAVETQKNEVTTTEETQNATEGQTNTEAGSTSEGQGNTTQGDNSQGQGSGNAQTNS